MEKKDRLQSRCTKKIRRTISAAKLLIVVFPIVVVSAVPGFAGTSDSNSTSAHVKPTPDYKNTKFTGDWGGQRTKLAEKGVTLDIYTVQSYQGVLDGGRDSQWKYGGYNSFLLKLDFQKMGLWPGAFMEIGAEDQFGEFINGKTGAMIPANTDGVLPEPGKHDVYLDRVVFKQFFSDQFGLFLGKVTTLTESGGDWNLFASGRGDTQFMNMAFVINPVTLQTAPYSTLGGGLIFLFPSLSPSPSEHSTLVMSVIGPDGLPGEWPWHDYSSGTAYNAEFKLPTRFFKKPGGQFFGATYSTKDFAATDQDPRLILADLIRGLPPTLQKHEGSSCFYYNFISVPL